MKIILYLLSITLLVYCKSPGKKDQTEASQQAQPDTTPTVASVPTVQDFYAIGTVVYSKRNDSLYTGTIYVARENSNFEATVENGHIVKTIVKSFSGVLLDEAHYKNDLWDGPKKQFSYEGLPQISENYRAGRQFGDNITYLGGKLYRKLNISDNGVDYYLYDSNGKEIEHTTEKSTSDGAEPLKVDVSFLPQGLGK